MRVIGARNASRRMPLLVGLAALLGGCVSTMDHSVDRSFAEPLSRAEPAVAQAVSDQPVDDGEWRLRLSYL